jgi:two-component system chemotaxis response regulator CheY
MPTATIPMQADSASPPPSRALRILYADDMPELRELLTEVLMREGHYIETVGDGDEALARLQQARSGFDLLITDHHMPGVNGLDLVRQTRELQYPGKIVVISSELSETVLEQYREFAVDAILAKPIFPLTLRTVLEQLFAEGHPQSTREQSATPFLSAHG